MTFAVGQKGEMMDDLISRQAAIDVIEAGRLTKLIDAEIAVNGLKALPSAQPEIIRCKDCKFYSPMNRETKTGICNLIMHQNFGDNWFCAGAERRFYGYHY